MGNFLANVIRRGAGLASGPVRAGAEVLPDRAVSQSTAVEPLSQSDAAAVEVHLEERVRADRTVDHVPEAAEPAASLKTGSVVNAATRLFIEPPSRIETVQESLPATRSMPQALTADSPQTEPVAAASGKVSPHPTAEEGTATMERISPSLPIRIAKEVVGPATQALVPAPTSERRTVQVEGEAVTDAIRPAQTAAALVRLPRVAKPNQGQEPPPNIHVKIGRIEVRGKAAPATPPQPPKPAAAPLGFARYARQRMYRNWPS